MKIIKQVEIDKLKINNQTIMGWVKKSFLTKRNTLLPHKISQNFNDGNNFYNTMPAINPLLDTYGVKIVNRYKNRIPLMNAELLLYSFTSGKLLSLMDATWITTVRSAAVAALAVETFAVSNFKNIALVGFGQIGYSFVDMLLLNPEMYNKTFKLKAYKGQEFLMKDYLVKKGVKNVEIYNTNKNFIIDSDVIISSVTVANGLFGEDKWYKEGVLVVPIHTRGFQNCDLFFDRVFGDDTAHIANFKNFNKFKYFSEFDKVLLKEDKGRQSEKERIISYNIGLALHDIMLGKNIYDLIIEKNKR